VLQGDDLRQLALQRQHAWAMALKSSLRAWLPNLDRLFALCRHHARELRPIREEWAMQVAAITGSLDAEQKVRFAALDPEVKARFLAHDLSPSLVAQALAYPDYLQLTLEPGAPAARDAIDLAAGYLAEIAAVCRRHDARALCVAVPYGPYTSPTALQGQRRVGYRLPGDALRSDAPDRAIELACSEAGIPFASAMAAVRAACAQQDDLYFVIDGHFTARGQGVFGHAVAQRLLQRELADGKH
jgi:hypothetical protein